MTEHVHEWVEYAAPNYDPPPYIRCKHCMEPMGKEEQLVRLNATERLSADRARNLLGAYKAGQINIYFALTTIRSTLQAYADILEGK